MRRAGAVLDRAQQGGGERVAQIVEQDADAGGPVAAQIARSQVVPVVELDDGLVHPGGLSGRRPLKMTLDTVFRLTPAKAATSDGGLFRIRPLRESFRQRCHLHQLYPVNLLTGQLGGCQPRQRCQMIAIDGWSP